MPAEDEHIPTKDIVELSSRYGGYGYRRITALPRHRGWDVNHKRVERIWLREGLKSSLQSSQESTTVAQ